MPCPSCSAGAYSKYLGHVALTFDDAGVVTAATGDTMLLDASVTPEPGDRSPASRSSPGRSSS